MRREASLNKINLRREASPNRIKPSREARHNLLHDGVVKIEVAKRLPKQTCDEVAVINLSLRSEAPQSREAR